MLAVVPLYSSDRILIKNKSTDLDWMTGCVSLFYLYVYISVECYGMCVPTNAMAMGPAQASPASYPFTNPRGETSIDPYTIEIPLIFPRTKKIFFPYPILTDLIIMYGMRMLVYAGLLSQ